MDRCSYMTNGAIFSSLVTRFLHPKKKKTIDIKHIPEVQQIKDIANNREIHILLKHSSKKQK